MTFASPAARRGANAYAQTATDAALTASPHQLIAMLFEGALNAIALAQYHVAQADIPAKGLAISKAINIIENGLKASLDPGAGGPEGARVAATLTQLYESTVRLLLYANLHNDADALQRAKQLIEPVA